jgi:hypothetical protein
MAKITRTSVHSVNDRVYSRNARRLVKNAIHLERGRSFAWQVASDAITKLKLLAPKENNNNINSKRLSSYESANTSVALSENIPILPSSDLFFSHVEKVCARKLAALTETRNDTDGNLRKSNRLRERYIVSKDRRLCIANYYLRKARSYALMREMERSELIAQYKAEAQASPYAKVLLDQTHNSLVQHTVTAMNIGVSSPSSPASSSMDNTQLSNPLASVVAGVFHPINCPQVAHLHTHTCHQNRSVKQLSSAPCSISDKITMSNAGHMDPDYWYTPLFLEEKEALSLWRATANEMYHRYLTADSSKFPSRDASSYAAVDITVVPPPSTPSSTPITSTPIAPHCVPSTVSSIRLLNSNDTPPSESAFIRIMALMVTGVAILPL